MNIVSFGDAPRAVLRRKIIHGILHKQSTKTQLLEAVTLWEITFGSHEKMVQHLAEYARLLLQERPDLLMTENMVVNSMMQGFTKVTLYEDQPDLGPEAEKLYNNKNSRMMDTVVMPARMSGRQAEAGNEIQVRHGRDDSNVVALNAQTLFVELVRRFGKKLKSMSTEQHWTVFLQLLNDDSSIAASDKKLLVQMLDSTGNVSFNWTTQHGRTNFTAVYTAALQTIGPVKTDQLLKSTVNEIRTLPSDIDVELYL